MDRHIVAVAILQADSLIYSALAALYGVLAIGSRQSGNYLHSWVYATTGILHALMAICHHLQVGVSG